MAGSREFSLGGSTSPSPGAQTCLSTCLNSKFVAFMAWHKTGTFFLRSLVHTALPQICHLNASQWSPSRRNRGPPTGCGVAEVQDHSQLTASHIFLRQPAGAMALVFMIREPTSTVISSYGYHRAGYECTREKWHSKWRLPPELQPMCHVLLNNRTSLNAGLFYTAEFVLQRILPSELEVFSAIASARRPDALCLRMEDFH